MKSNWTIKTLSEVCTKIGSGQTPRGGKESYKGGRFALVRSQNIHNQGFTENGLVYINDLQADQLSNVEIQSNDVFINITGHSVTRCCMVPDEILPARVNQHVAILRADNKFLDSGFLRYFLISPKIQRTLLSLSSGGATRKALTKSMLESFEIVLPTLLEQKTIAHILGTFDQKIALNKKTNKTLEGIAKSLFNSWFVDFDPVKAKAEGRSTGLPDEISDLFPDSVEDSELGQIPEGWSIDRLSEFANISGGKQLSEGKLKGKGQFPVYGANGVMGFHHEKTNHDFVIIFGRVGAYCGSVKWEYKGAWVNNNASSIVPLKNPEFILQSMLRRDYTNLRSGSAQPFISNSALSNSKIINPAAPLKDLYCQISRPLLLKQKAKIIENIMLTAFRNTLLPKLISGELKIPDAEKIIEEVRIY